MCGSHTVRSPSAASPPRPPVLHLWRPINPQCLKSHKHVVTEEPLKTVLGRPTQRKPGLPAWLGAGLASTVGGSLEGPSALTMEPGGDGVGRFLVACSQGQLLLFKPPDDVLLGRAGYCPCHSLISVIYRTIYQVSLTNLKIMPSIYI